MLVTITNLSSTAKLNTPQVIDNRLTGTQADLYATGGAVDNPLPYPFDRVDEVAASGTIVRAMHPADFRRQLSHESHEPARQWNLLVQAGIVSFAQAAETGRRDIEELFITAV